MISAAAAMALSFHEAPKLLGDGKMMPPGAPEWSVSITKDTGMPSRLRSTKLRCSSFRARTSPAGVALPFAGRRLASDHLGR